MTAPALSAPTARPSVLGTVSRAILLTAVTLWAIGGWVCVAVIAYQNASPTVIEACPKPKPVRGRD